MEKSSVLLQERKKSMKLRHDKVIGLGEILLRLTAPKGVLLKDSSSFAAFYGGSEANVIISLAELGHKTAFLTRLSDNPLGEGALAFLRKTGVECTGIIADPHPLGIYFLEEGEGARSAQVIYDRKDSAATFMKPGDFSFPDFYKDAAILHVSGITLSISDSAAQTALAAMKEARKAGLKVSFDFNYRAKLISVSDAKKRYQLALRYADIVSASPWDIQTLLGFEPTEKNQDKLFQDVCAAYGFDYLFTKKRTILSAKEQTLQAFAYTKDKVIQGKERRFEVFDRIGAGDAFAAGYLHGLLNDYGNPEKAIDLALANAILKQTIAGDQARFHSQDLEAYLASAGTEEVRR
jgi:2-dehydro-3-deoxygluconokinase